jgi:hypothetical protein
MKYHQVISHFGSISKTAQALGSKRKKVTRQTVFNWLPRGRIPPHWQLRLAKLSGGVLKPDAEAKQFAREISEVLNRK